MDSEKRERPSGTFLINSNGKEISIGWKLKYGMLPWAVGTGSVHSTPDYIEYEITGGQESSDTIDVDEEFAKIIYGENGNRKNLDQKRLEKELEKRLKDKFGW